MVFRKKDAHRTRMNSIRSIIRFGLKSQTGLTTNKVKTIVDLRREIEKAIKKIDLTYVQDVIDVFRGRVRSAEDHDGELIIDKHILDLVVSFDSYSEK